MSLDQIGHASRRVVERASVLREPVIVSEFWCNRRGESVRVQLRQFEGVPLLDVRKYYTGAAGKLLPTAKGLALAVRRLPELHAAIGKALAKAHELGLIKPPVQP